MLSFQSFTGRAGEVFENHGSKAGSWLVAQQRVKPLRRGAARREARKLAKSAVDGIDFPMASSPHVVCIYISPGHNFYGRYGQAAGEHAAISVPHVECIASKGLIGDRFFDYKDDYKGQITFFAWETYEELCRRFGVTDKNPGVFRRNVVTRGVDLNEWIGKEFEIQGVLFEGTQEASPCSWMNQAFFEGAEAAMQGHGGLRAKILTDGMLRVDAK